MPATNFVQEYKEPFSLFELWLREAGMVEENDPNAMALSTADKKGKVSVRMMLLKGVDENGFVFYTNLNSPKGQNLIENPNAALCFYWKSQRRQIRVTGRVEKVSDQAADAYFATRPRGSQIGAWASEQSYSLLSRDALEGKIKEIERKFEGKKVKRPPYWSGFCLIPDEVEFWQAGQYRLHDRFVFMRGNEDWTITRLNP